MMEISDNMVALGVIIISMMVPIVAILSKHQLKMTALLRQESNNGQVSEELRELKGIVAQQALTIDSILQSQRQLGERLAASSKLEDQIQIRG